MKLVSRRSVPRPVFAFLALLFCLAPCAAAADIAAGGGIRENGSFCASFQSTASDGPILQGNLSVTAAPEPTSLFLLSGATILALALWRRSKIQ